MLRQVMNDALIDAELSADLIEEFIRVVNTSNGITHQGKQQGKRKRRRSFGSAYEGDKNARGGIFFGVCRGRMSEGLSLSDHLVRLVIVVGIPYPSIADVRIGLKKQIFNNCPIVTKGGKLDGNSWYVRQA